MTEPTNPAPQPSDEAREAGIRETLKAHPYILMDAALGMRLLDAARVEIATLRDDPEMDATDFAHPAWWRGHDHTTAVFCRLVNEILDGKEVSGISNEPWQSLRLRLARLRSAAPTRDGDHKSFSEALEEAAAQPATSELRRVYQAYANNEKRRRSVQDGNLRAENERLRAALQPFADRANYFDRVKMANGGEWPDEYSYADEPPSELLIGQLRAARDALASLQPDAGARGEFTRCLRCIGHELTRDLCFYEGKCLRGEVEHIRGLVKQAKARHPIDAPSPSPEAAPPSVEDAALEAARDIFGRDTLNTSDGMERWSVSGPTTFTMQYIASRIRPALDAAHQAGVRAGREFVAEYLQNAIDDDTIEITQDLIQAIVDDVRHLALDPKEKRDDI